jgi:hypothetical protein
MVLFYAIKIKSLTYIRPDQWCAYTSFLQLDKNKQAREFFRTVNGSNMHTRMLLELELNYSYQEPSNLDHYLEVFGSKRCCYVDLRKYLHTAEWDKNKVISRKPRIFFANKTER